MRVLNNENFLLYVRSDKLCKHFKEVTDKCEEELKSLTGWSSDRIPEEAQEYWEQLGQHIFYVPTIPYQSVKYAKLFKRLMEDKKKLQKSGDWIKIIQGVEDEFTGRYSLKTIRGEKYASVESILKAMEDLKEATMEMQIRQPVKHFSLI
jgi:predicted translin family RNA/ssDNA-binding protein